MSHAYGVVTTYNKLTIQQYCSNHILSNNIFEAYLFKVKIIVYMYHVNRLLLTYYGSRSQPLISTS